MAGPDDASVVLYGNEESDSFFNGPKYRFLWSNTGKHRVCLELLRQQEGKRGFLVPSLGDDEMLIGGPLREKWDQLLTHARCHICTHSKIKETWLESFRMNEPMLGCKGGQYRKHKNNRKNDLWGGEAWRGEKDNKPIIGLRETFHQYTHLNLHTKGHTRTHRNSLTSFYHTFTHIFRAPFKQMHSWLNIEECLWQTEQGRSSSSPWWKSPHPQKKEVA